MTRQEYAAYEQEVLEFFEREGLNNLSCEEDCDEYENREQCECCGLHDWGRWHKASGYNPTTKEVQSYIVCADCIYYVEYGQLDDQTMLDMEEE